MTDINNRATQEFKTEVDAPSIVPTAEEVEVVGFVQDTPDEEPVDGAQVEQTAA